MIFRFDLDNIVSNRAFDTLESVFGLFYADTLKLYMEITNSKNWLLVHKNIEKLVKRESSNICILYVLNSIV